MLPCRPAPRLAVWSSQAQAQSFCNFSLPFWPGPGWGAQPPERSRPALPNEPRLRKTAAAAPSGLGQCLVVAALNPQDRGLKRFVQETKRGSVCPTEARAAQGRAGPGPSEPLPFSSLVPGYSFVSIHEFTAPPGRQTASWLHLWETESGRNSPWAGASSELW